MVLILGSWFKGNSFDGVGVWISRQSSLIKELCINYRIT